MLLTLRKSQSVPANVLSYYAFPWLRRVALNVFSNAPGRVCIQELRTVVIMFVHRQCLPVNTLPALFYVSVGPAGFAE